MSFWDSKSSQKTHECRATVQMRNPHASTQRSRATWQFRLAWTCQEANRALESHCWHLSLQDTSQALKWWCSRLGNWMKLVYKLSTHCICTIKPRVNLVIKLILTNVATYEAPHMQELRSMLHCYTNRRRDSAEDPLHQHSNILEWLKNKVMNIDEANITLLFIGLSVFP